MSPYGPQNLPYPQLRNDMQEYMRRLIREGRLPHDLLDQHWFRGEFHQIGPHEILASTAEYFPVDGLATPEGVPETLAQKDYSPARVTELFDRWKQHMHDINQKRIAAGKKPRDVDGLTLDNSGIVQDIDGIKCLLLASWLEAGINYKKVIDAVLKPLGYAKAKGKQDSYQKRISESEVLTCAISVPAMWRVRELYASLGYRRGEKEVHFRLLYWGVFHRVRGQDVDNMGAMMITTERTFRMAVENIGFLVTALERDCLEEWRKALGHGDS
jgi:hypothetical protein